MPQTNQTKNSESLIPNLDSLLKNPLQKEAFVKEFADLCRNYGLQSEAQDLDRLASSIDDQTKRLVELAGKVNEMQKEVDALNTDTPLTAQFKKEMQTRTFNIYEGIGNMYLSIKSARDSIIDACKNGLQTVKEMGKSTLHHSLSAVYSAGRRFFEANYNFHKDLLETSKSIINYVDELSSAKQTAKEQRSNLIRTMLGRDTKDDFEAHVSLPLRAIRNMAQNTILTSSEGMEINKDMIDDMSAKIEHHQKSAKTPDHHMPSLNDLINSAKARVSNVGKSKDTQKQKQEEHTLQ